jgi:hypothetical protein
MSKSFFKNTNLWLLLSLASLLSACHLKENGQKYLTRTAEDHHPQCVVWFHKST